MDVELIPMEVPQDKGHQVYVTKIIWNGSREELENTFEKLFLVFGLIFKVTAKSFTTDEGEICWYVYVVFYSARAAKSAVEYNGKIFINERIIKIRPTLRSGKTEKIVISLTKAQELLTYYFGFNCWTSDIVFLERETESVEPDAIQYLCMVRVKMPKQGLTSEGLGLSKVPYDPKLPSARGIATGTCQKFAIHAAMKAAFGKFIIITLDNGKASVEVDTTQCDPLLYDPAWDNPLIKVNDIIYDPDEEQECEELNAMTEEQLQEILNQSF